MVFLILILLISYSLSYLFITKKYEQIVFDELKMSAKMLAEQIVLTRKWVSLHGAILVEKNEELEPNPFLSEPYVVDKKGKIYIKMNPAFVTREISKLAEKERGFYFRVVSLKTINPKNTPDNFEKGALLELEKSGNFKEFYRIEDRAFRYVTPLYTEEACLACHKNYEVGSVRGGLSIYLSAEDLLERLKKAKVNFFLIITGFYSLIFIGFLLFFKASVLNPIESLILFAEGKDLLKRKMLIKTADFNVLYNKLKESKMKDEKLKEQLEEEIKKATFELKEINNKKTEFLLEIGHKLKTPLTVISTSVDYLMMKGSCKEDESFLALLKKNVESLRRATNQILKTAQIEMGILEERFEKLELGDLILETMDYFNYENFVLNLDTNIFIYGDKEKLQMLFENIIHNAIKFNKEGHKIYVTLKKEGRYALCTIRDEGIGIEEEDRKRIFEKFYHKDFVGKEKGTGLGLYISKRVVEMHRGELDFISKKGEGTTFFIRMPLMEGGIEC